MYTPFLYHSNYGRGGSSFEMLFENLKKYNIRSCGIVDETFFGIPEFIKYTKAYSIKPIIGAEILPRTLGDILLPDAKLRKTSQKTPHEFSPFQHKVRGKLYLFIKNQTGYGNLCQILTKQAFQELNPEFIKEHTSGLVALSNSLELLRLLREAFKEIYYLVLPYQTPLRNEFPPFAANEIFYAIKQERILYRLMSVIKDYEYEHKRGFPNHLLTDEEFNKIFSVYPEAVNNNQRLSEVCNFRLENRGWVFPESKQNLYEIIKPKIQNLPPQDKARIDYEYKIIKDMGFEPYFALVHRLKEFALSKGIGMNVRGSAASSFILFVLGLSIANPMKYNLPFERFLNPRRNEPPDIDVDVEFTQRERLIQEIYREFGKEYVAHVSSINRFQSRARFRDTARAYGISPQELKNIRNHLGEKIFKDIIPISQKIANYPHYFSCHASGLVLTPKPINTFVPLYPSPAGQITNYDKDGIGIVGLVKIDILGVRGFPSLFLTKDKIDFDDQNVYKFISANKTLGCFQIESPLARQMLRRIQPKTLMHIANAIAIIRPGPSQGGMKQRFLKRLKGEEDIEYPHPILEKALKETLGIPVYQEQILQIAHDFARFSLGEGDMLRRAMTKERNSDRMKELQQIFFNKAEKMEYSKKEIEAVWMRIKSFSSFGFNKAHSITYATLAYLSAYQKLYNPYEFFCQVINNKGGYYPSIAYINEARRWGIKILGPDVKKSMLGFTNHNSSLLTGLNEIKNLSLSVIQKILKFRPFKNPQEFFYQVRPSIDEGVSLIKSRALDSFEKPWPELYFHLLNTKSQSGTKTELNEKIPEFKDFSNDAKLKYQLETIGFLPQCHILELLYPMRSTRIVNLTNGKHYTVIGTPIVHRPIMTKTNEIMSFLTIDDETGVLEVVIFPAQYKQNPIAQIMEIKGAIKDDSFIVDSTPGVEYSQIDKSLILKIIDHAQASERDNKNKTQVQAPRDP